MNRIFLTVALMVPLVLCVAPMGAHASIQSPSSCQNLYYVSLDKVFVEYPGGTLDPLTNPNQTITMDAATADNTTWYLSIVVAVSPTSTNGTTGPGTLYLVTDTGYTSGFCYATAPQSGIDVTGGELLNMTFAVSGRGPSSTGLGVSVLAGLDSTQTATFNIDWVTPSASTTTSSTTTVATYTTPEFPNTILGPVFLAVLFVAAYSMRRRTGMDIEIRVGLAGPVYRVGNKRSKTTGRRVRKRGS